MTFVSTSQLKVASGPGATPATAPERRLELRVIGMHCAACVSRV
jgi:hypothetical protein